jgi:hypothetical protein
MDSLTNTRRGFLAVSVPFALAVAGCSSISDDATNATDAATTASTTTTGDTNTEATTEEETTVEDQEPETPFPDLDADGPTFRRWQPAPDDVGWTFDVAHNFSRLRERRGRVSAATYESNSMWAMFPEYVGVEYEEMDGLLVGVSGPGAVLIGSYARSDVESRLRGSPYAEYAASGNVTYFEWTDTGRSWFVGVGDDGVVFGPADREASDPGETFVADTTPIFEVRRGERPRYHEANDRYRRYTDAVGWPLVAGTTVPQSVNDRGFGAGASTELARAVDDDVAASIRVAYAQHVADGSLVDRYWLRVTDGAEVSAEGVASAFQSRDAQQELANDGEAVAVRRDGRVVEVGVLDPVDDPGGGVDPVIADFDATLDRTTFTLEHLVGDDLPLSRVTILAGGDEVDGAGDGTLAAGESLTLDVPNGTEGVRVIYSPPHAESTTVIAQA